MKAIEIRPKYAKDHPQYKRPSADDLVVGELPVPKPGPGEVLIKVAAAGVNGPDLMQRLGLYDPPKGHSTVLGLEVSGEIVDVGEGVEQHTVGDRVCALANGGGYAEFCAVPAGQALRIPAGIGMVEAACIPETFFTVWYNLFLQTNVLGERMFDRYPKPSLLVHGGSSGIGTTAIQLARAFGSDCVLATAGSEEKCKACLDLGATAAVNYRDPDVSFDKVVLEKTDRKGVDIVLDMVVGKEYTQKNLNALRRGGRMAIIGFKGGAKVQVNMTQVLTKALTISGSTLRTCPDATKALIASELGARVWPMFESGQLRVVMDSSFPMSEAAAAHRKMETSKHIGKIAIVVGDA